MSETYLDMAPQSERTRLARKHLGLGGESAIPVKAWNIPSGGLNLQEGLAFQAPLSGQMAPKFRKLKAIHRLAQGRPAGARMAKFRAKDPVAIKRWSRGSAKSVLAHGGLTVTSLDKAVQALATLTADDGHLAQGDLRIGAARLLRRAAVDQSRLSPRVGSIALLLSDALINSPDIDASMEKRKALRLGLDLLMDSFVSEAQERSLIRSLMDAGWETTAPFDHDEFADLIDLVGG